METAINALANDAEKRGERTKSTTQNTGTDS